MLETYLLLWYCSFSFLEWYIHRNYNADLPPSGIFSILIGLNAVATGLNWITSEPVGYGLVWLLTTTTFAWNIETFTRHHTRFDGYCYNQTFPGTDIIVGTKSTKEELSWYLMGEGIADANATIVHDCLILGADPNFEMPYNLHEPKETQPITPLQLVLFYVSKTLVTKSDISTYITITKLLLDYGARADSAITYCQSLLGDKDDCIRIYNMDGHNIRNLLRRSCYETMLVRDNPIETIALRKRSY